MANLCGNGPRAQDVWRFASRANSRTDSNWYGPRGVWATACRHGLGSCHADGGGGIGAPWSRPIDPDKSADTESGCPSTSGEAGWNWRQQHSDALGSWSGGAIGDAV